MYDPSVHDNNLLFFSMGNQWTAERMRNVFSKVMAVQGLNLSVSQYRHVAIAFGRRILDDRQWEIMLSTIDEQAGHSSDTADVNYAISNVDARSIGPIAMQRFFDASWSWHSLLKLAPDRIQVHSVVDPLNTISGMSSKPPSPIRDTECISQLKNQLSSITSGLKQLQDSLDLNMSKTSFCTSGTDFETSFN